MATSLTPRLGVVISSDSTGNSALLVTVAVARAELAFSPSSGKWPGDTFLDVKSRLESIARIGLLKKNDPEVAYGR